MTRSPRTHNRHHTARAVGGGASRKAKSRSYAGLLGWVLKAVAVTVGCALVVGLCVWMEPAAYLQKLANRPIVGVTIEGQFVYVTKQRVQELLVGRVAENFLQMDMAELKTFVERDPWIDKVSVSRQWPDRLVVRIQEQQPIARWGRDAFVNMRGDIIDVGDNSALAHLPLLEGSDRYASDVMQQYVQIARLLAPANLGLKAVHLDDTLSWTLRLESDVIVKVGRDQIFEKLQRFLDVYPKNLAARAGHIASVDLRYENGFAVGWKNAAADELVADAK